MSGIRAARHWAELALHVSLLVTALVLFQVVAERTNRRLDLTPSRELSLAPITEQVLREVSGPLRVTVFHRRGSRQQFAPLLERLAAASEHLRYELVDLDRHPDRARALGVSQYGTAALEYDGRLTLAAALPEEHLVSGIVKVLRQRGRRILFVTGHGERAPGGDDEGYGRFAASLEREHGRVEPGTLLGGGIPDGVELMIVAGPRRDFLPVETERLGAYLRRGGAVLLLLEPGALPNLTAFLRRLGIRIADDFIVDHERSVVGTDGLAAIVELFKRGNPISEPGGTVMDTGVVLPSARSVDVIGAVPEVAAEAIARTGASAWTMRGTERARRGEAPSEEAQDRPGGAAVMVMAEVRRHPDAGRPGRLVVVGDADFASDAYLDLLGNRDLVLNAVAWLTEEPMLAGERPTRPNEVFRPLSPLVLSEDQAGALLLAVGVVEPGLVLLAGAVVVGIRRRRG
jgi:hypothetical protein